MCHKLKEEGDLGFIIKTLEQDVNLATALGDKSAAKVALKNAIPEFKRFNIIEGDIRDAV